MHAAVTCPGKYFYTGWFAAANRTAAKLELWEMGKNEPDSSFQLL